MPFANSIIHIGFHKTGTTSIQRFLGQQRGRLLELGIAYYRGHYGANNHTDLHAALRFEAMTGFKMRRRVEFNDQWREDVQAHIAAFANDNGGRRLLFSSEGLSLMRHDDEVQRLKDMVPGPHQIIVYLRNKRDWFESYTAEVQQYKAMDTRERIDKNAFYYTGDDSWVLDFEARVAPFKQVFGDDAVTVVDYDACVRDEGNVIPSFLRIIGVERAFAPSDWNSIFANARPKA